jgi:nucleotide-binding universal stress UspA family protein
MAGAELILPPGDLLGNFLTPGDPEGLLEWLEPRLAGCDAALLSLDMLCWGGLVASRRPDTSPLEGQLRLAMAASLLEGRPLLRLAFMAVTRNAPNQTSPEEVERARLFSELSLLMARQMAGDLDAGPEIREMKSRLPPEALQEYLAVRGRNHRVARRAVDGPWDFLLFGIDDSRAQGLNLLEASQLQADLGRRGRAGAVAPGTDEMALLLLARALAPGRTLEVVWDHPRQAESRGLYEDRPLGQVLTAQAAAAGLALGPSSRQLWVYGPSGRQTEAALQKGSPRSARAARFAERLERALEKGAVIVVADVARANGADLALAGELSRRRLFPRLAGYAAWNTAGNTLGTALATLALTPEHPTAERTRFLLERLADDWLYQARLRQRLGPGLRLEEEARARAEGRVARDLARQMARLCRFWGLPVPRLRARLPWPRTFEVEVEIEP